jgi:hypothetical protein
MSTSGIHRLTFFSTGEHWTTMSVLACPPVRVTTWHAHTDRQTERVLKEMGKLGVAVGHVLLLLSKGMDDVSQTRE